jgi:DUF971 family protein
MSMAGGLRAAAHPSSSRVKLLQLRCRPLASATPLLGARSVVIRRAGRTLDVSLTDGRELRLSAELLRVHSPSAEMRGASGERRMLAGKRGVTVVGAEAVGAYAVRLVFSDLHDTGLYSWPLLALLHRDRCQLARAYISSLKQLGLSRHHRARVSKPTSADKKPL